MSRQNSSPYFGLLILPSSRPKWEENRKDGSKQIISIFWKCAVESLLKDVFILKQG